MDDSCFAETMCAFGNEISAALGKLAEAVDRRTILEGERLLFQKDREARLQSEDLEWRLLYERRTMEFQAIAMRLGDMVEKQYHVMSRWRL